MDPSKYLEVTIWLDRRGLGGIEVWDRGYVTVRPQPGHGASEQGPVRFESIEDLPIRVRHSVMSAGMEFVDDPAHLDPRRRV